MEKAYIKEKSLAAGSTNTNVSVHQNSSLPERVVEYFPDRVLVERFARSGDEPAFEALVERHGSMVLRVCRQMLGDLHDAEDAFQATFLILACKANSVRRYDSLTSWLYGVALRVAKRSRRAALRRREHETRSAELKPVQNVDHDASFEAYEELHKELVSLPERLKLPVILCYLEGMTAEAAADRLGCPRGTILSRLSQARERLRRRLTRRGLVLPAGFLAVGASGSTVEAGVSTALTKSVVHSAAQVAAGKSVAETAGVGVANLAGGVLKSMLLTKGVALASAAIVALSGVTTTAVFVIGTAGRGSSGSEAEQAARLQSVCNQWEASAKRLSGSLKIRLTTRIFLEPIRTKGPPALTTRPSMRDRERFERPLLRKRRTPIVEPSIVLYEFAGGRYRVRRYRRESDVPDSPEFVEAWNGDTWKVAAKDYGAIRSGASDGLWFEDSGLSYNGACRDIEVALGYVRLIRQRKCTVEDDRGLIKIHAPEQNAPVSSSQTYFTFWLDPTKGMLPVRFDRGTAGNPVEARVDIQLQEIKPSLWAPIVTRAKLFDMNKGTPTYGSVYSEIEHTVEMASSQFGAKFSDSNFTLTFPASIKVDDYRLKPLP